MPTFDFAKVTPRQAIEFAERTGTNLLDLIGAQIPGSTDPTVVAGLIWVALRSERPDARWDEALDTPILSLTFVAGDEE